jgi:LmbE family N-acetylglucosaminyl deacetylase
MPAAQLLVVTAHPDDEVLGLGGLISLSARAGARVTLVCATRGEAGEIADPALATPETLGTVREAELRAACALLGIGDLRLLDYRDSGMAGTLANQDPNAFCNAAPGEVVARLVALIRRLQPAVVVTWDPSGGYGHPDHVAASRHTAAAFDLAGHPVLPEAGAPHSPAALYYMTRPPHLREEVRAELAARGIRLPPASRPSSQLLLASAATTLQLDVMAALDIKRAARAAHRTQGSPMARIDLLSPDLQRRYAGTEYFHRARPPLPAGERDTLLPDLLGLNPAESPRGAGRQPSRDGAGGASGGRL